MKVLLILILISTSLALSTVSATVINVPEDQPSIQAGIDASVNGDTVLVQPGAYIENIEFNGHCIVLGSLFLTTGDASYISTTIIDGDSSGSVVRIENVEDSTTILTGFTIQNGAQSVRGGVVCFHSNPIIKYNIIKDNMANYAGGGGINCSYANPVIANNLITGNRCIEASGSGISLWHSDPLIINNTVAANYGDSTSGGGIFCYNSNPIIINTIFWNNNSVPGREINLFESSPSFSHCDIQGGWEGEGNINTDPLFRYPDNGDFYLMGIECGDTIDSPCIDAGDYQVSDSIMSCLNGMGTSRSDIGAYGGGYLPHTGIVIYVPDDYPDIQSAINGSLDKDTIIVRPGIYDEDINFYGHNVVLGSLFLMTGDTSYISSTIISDGGPNVAFENGEDSTAAIIGFTIQEGNAIEGAGIYCYNSNPIIRNNVIRNNIVQGIYSGGGGIACINSSPLIAFNIIYGNYAYIAGGGIGCRDNSNPRIVNNTIYGNSTGPNYGGGGLVCVNSYPLVANTIFWGNEPQSIRGNEPIVSYCNVEGGWEGEGNIDIDPLFVDAENGDFQLQAGSPCIDAGDPDSPYDSDGTRADMGALYYHYRDRVINIPADYLSIQEGVDASVDGDTVLVDPGIYVENVYIYGRSIVLGSLFLTSGDTNYISQTIIDGDSSGSVVKFRNIDNGFPAVIGFTIQNGFASSGGGVSCSYSDAIISNNYIRDNISDNRGGGIYCGHCDPIVKDNVVADNSASTWGSGLCIFEANALIYNNVIKENGFSYAGWGGGIFCSASSLPEINNNLIASNMAYCGGGVYCSAVFSRFRNNTFSENFAISGGGGMNVGGGYSLVENCILWGDSAEVGNNEINIGSGTYLSYCNIEGGWDGEGNINADPQFVDHQNGDFHLQPSSPCIDAGNPESPLDPDSTRVDIGAFYYNQMTDIQDISYLPYKLSITQNYPNPFNASTSIYFSLPRSEDVNLTVYDILGRKVEELAAGEHEAGMHRVIWQADGYSSGLYFYVLETEKSRISRKMMLLR
ncbi:MAG: DUF1565 domain-containing protein [candidate division Zixibacteria bacterium]|nr:DUF1565 domain-containing protein [candidate division Zixibacteria bacterium]